MAASCHIVGAVYLGRPTLPTSSVDGMPHLRCCLRSLLTALVWLTPTKEETVSERASVVAILGLSAAMPA